MSDTSSSPNLLDKDDYDEDPSADVDEEDDDNDDPSAEVDEEEEDDDVLSADVEKYLVINVAIVDEEDESLDEVNVEAIVEKKGRSRFRWSHTADCIVDNGNLKDEAWICMLLAKEPWNAGHGWVMKAWQNLLAIVLEMVVDGDRIFQGVSEATLKKGINYILMLARNGRWKRRKEANQRTKKRNMI